jgi:hypothetical protein
MHPQTSAQIEKELRSAAVQQRYGDVERLITLFCAAAAHEAKVFTPGAQDHLAVLTHAEEVFDWTSMVLRVGRATTAGELARLIHVEQFLGPKQPARGSLRIRG